MSLLSPNHSFTLNPTTNSLTIRCSSFDKRASKKQKSILKNKKKSTTTLLKSTTTLLYQLFFGSCLDVNNNISDIVIDKNNEVNIKRVSWIDEAVVGEDLHQVFKKNLNKLL